MTHPLVASRIHVKHDSFMLTHKYETQLIHIQFEICAFIRDMTYSYVKWLVHVWHKHVFFDEIVPFVLCMYISMHITYIYMYVYMCINIYIYIWICIKVCVYIYIYIYIHIHIHIYIYIHTYIHLCIYMYMYQNIHTYMQYIYLYAIYVFIFV